MLEKKENTFFTKHIYTTEIALDVNAGVLERIWNSGLAPGATLPVEFFYVSDQEEKLGKLMLQLLANFSAYSDFKVQPYNENFELLGNTDPIRMDLNTINEWNQLMWDIGR